MKQSDVGGSGNLTGMRPMSRAVDSDDGTAGNLTSPAATVERYTVHGMDMGEVSAIASRIATRRARAARLTAEECDDLLQDVLERYVKTWPDGTEPDNTEAWFEEVTKNQLIDRFRAAERRPANEDIDDELIAAMSAIRAPVRTSLEAVRARLIDSVLALVPADDADLFRRRYLDGESAADLAESLGITVANVDQRSTRARRRLMDALSARPDLVAELRAAHPHLY